MSQGPDGARRAGGDPVAAAWRAALVELGDPRPREATRSVVVRLRRATTEAFADPDGPAPAELARVLVDTQLPPGATLATTLQLLTSVAAELPDGAARLPAVQRGVVQAFTEAFRDEVLLQQEAIQNAVLSARDAAEARERSITARFRALFDGSAIGIGIGDTQGQVLDVNPALVAMLGYSRKEFQSRRVSDFVHPDDAESIWRGYEALISGQIDVFRTEKRYIHRDGHDIWTNLTLSLVRGVNGQPDLQLALLEDVSERHALQEELLYAATHDALTALPNRIVLTERLEAALTATHRGRPALCFLDLDGFKMVNDTWGHLVGDQVLVALAERLSAEVEGTDVVLARWSGDEFVVLHPDLPASVSAEAFGRRYLAVLRHPLLLDGLAEPITVRASAGVVACDEGTPRTAPEVLRAADLALLAAKDEGRGRVVVHDSVRTAQQISRFGIAMSLRGVTERDELRLVYQPMVDLRRGVLHGVEALVRWNHPRMGELEPDQFVPVADESTAIDAIGRWVLDRVCRDLAAHPEWPSASVNVSLRELFRAGYASSVLSRLAAAGVSPSRLRIEVTESVLMQAGSEGSGPVAELHELATAGVRVALDDFGTGYSNLHSLRRMPVHELKLASTFVHGLAPRQPDPVDLALIGTVIDLAHSMRLVITAEGVESSRQDSRVRRMGCDVGQGWFYSRPLPAESVQQETRGVPSGQTG